MSVTERILSTLAASATPLDLTALMVKTGIGKLALSPALHRLVHSKRVTKHSRGMYSMTPDQRAELQPTPSGSASKLMAGISAIELSTRLRFLTELSQRPAFLGHALLGHIIDDYRRALNRVIGQEDRRND